MSRAWTSGPWSVVERGGIYTVTSPHGNPINCHEVADTWSVKPDADLIALAPEMAEAILCEHDEGCADCWGGRRYSARPSCVLADKLRAIDKEQA